jgi:hypothetical protein
MYAAVASTFGNKAPARSKRAVHGGYHRVGAPYPVQHRVVEDRIELFPERQSFSAHHVRVQPKLPRGLDLCSARIDCNYFTLEINQFFRECPVSATQIKNALAGLGC